MEGTKPNPKLLVTWAIAGAFLAASTWLLSFVPIHRLPAHGHGLWNLVWMNRLRIVTFFAPFVTGVTVTLWAERRLKRGIEKEIWSEAELEPVRTLISKPIWLCTSVILIIAIGLAAIFTGVHRTHTEGFFFYILLVPLQTTARMRQLLAPPKAKTTGVFMDWSSFKPIQSSHWGQPPVHPSE